MVKSTAFAQRMKSIQPFFAANKMLKTSLITLTLTTGLTGCSYLEPYKAPTTQGTIMTQESVSLLQAGLTQSQVRELLGPPMGANTFNPLHWEYIYYTTNKTADDKKLKTHLVLEFDQDRYLTGWQQNPLAVELKEDNTWLGLGWF